MQQESQLASAMLSWWEIEPTGCNRITSGHINETYLVQTSEARYILQRLHPIFGPEVNLDIEEITSQLESFGITTPRILRTTDGQLWATDDEDRTWRLLTYIPGAIVQRVDNQASCYTAGQLLGRFHQALWEFDYQFKHKRAAVHDTPRHLDRLREAMRQRSDHRLFNQIAPIGAQILNAAAHLRLPDGLPERIVHGDPKITNFVFGAHGQAIAILDLDTLGRMPIAVELGDALRSWCAPHGEEVEAPMDLQLFFAALRGYAQTVGNLPTVPERQTIPFGMELIAYELAARFCTDALEESYFHWDHNRFSSAAEHNLARARSQLVLALSVRERLSQMVTLVNKLWPRG